MRAAILIGDVYKDTILRGSGMIPNTAFFLPTLDVILTFPVSPHNKIVNSYTILDLSDLPEYSFRKENSISTYREKEMPDSGYLLLISIARG